MTGKKYIVEQNPFPRWIRIIYLIISAFFTIGLFLFILINGIIFEAIIIFVLLIFLWWLGLRDKPYKVPLWDVNKIYEVKLKELKGGEKK